MKIYKKIVIAYIFVMLFSLAIMAHFYNQLDLTNLELNSYSDEELKLHQKIWDSILTSVDAKEGQLFIYMLAFWAIILIIGLIFLVLVYLKEIKPVMEMKEYAAEIAKGNLEVELPIHKDNMFGSFTESFDLMREELKESKLREIEADNAKRELMAELSHDLKTPVATIKATCEVLDLKLNKQLNSLEELHEAEIVLSKADLLSQFSDLIEKNGYIMNKADLINSLVQDVFHANLDDLNEIKVTPLEQPSTIVEETFLKLKDSGNIIITNHIPECLVYMDKLRMEQVIDNIISNSYKYANTDIHVSFENIENADKKRFIKIKIKDDGPGVSDDDLPLITNKYYRGAKTKDKPGYGLGMYLAKWYMEKQNGGIDYYNDNGFVVELLLAKV